MPPLPAAYDIFKHPVHLKQPYREQGRMLHVDPGTSLVLLFVAVACTPTGGEGRADLIFFINSSSITNIPPACTVACIPLIQGSSSACHANSVSLTCLIQLPAHFVAVLLHGGARLASLPAANAATATAAWPATSRQPASFPGGHRELGQQQARQLTARRSGLGGLAGLAAGVLAVCCRRAALYPTTALAGTTGTPTGGWRCCCCTAAGCDNTSTLHSSVLQVWRASMVEKAQQLGFFSVQRTPQRVSFTLCAARPPTDGEHAKTLVQGVAILFRHNQAH